MNKTEQAVLDIARKKAKIRSSFVGPNVSTATGIRGRKVRRAITSLRRKGKIKPTGKYATINGGRAAEYVITS